MSPGYYNQGICQSTLVFDIWYAKFTQRNTSKFFKNRVLKRKQGISPEIDKGGGEWLIKENANNKVTDPSRPTNEKTPPKVTTDPTCNADELSLKTATADGGGAGTLNLAIVLTNTGTRTCDLFGFPGVSLVNANGNQVGKPADRATNYQEAKQTLKPGGSVKAIISYSNSGNFDSGTCQDGATKLRVYPPNDVGYLSTSTTLTTWCPGFMTSPVLAN